MAPSGVLYLTALSSRMESSSRSPASWAWRRSPGWTALEKDRPPDWASREKSAAISSTRALRSTSEKAGLEPSSSRASLSIS